MQELSIPGNPLFDMGAVDILRHYPDLGKTGLANVECAFEPWDTGERLDPNRHPLRAYDKRLQPDPWLGSAHR